MAGLLLFFIACTGKNEQAPEGGTLDAVATLESDIPTVAWVAWSTDSPGTSSVEYGPTESLGYATVASAVETTDHAVLLAGLPASSAWYWRAVSQVDGEELTSPTTEIQTGAAPRELPGITLGTFDASLAQPGYTLTTSLGEISWVILFNTDGDAVWWQQAPDQSVIAQARLAPDGTSIVYNIASLNFGIDLGEIRNVRLDGELLSTTRTVQGHHDFVALPEGGYAYIAADTRSWTDPRDGQVYDVVGDAIVEVPEGATDDSANQVIWSTWDDIDVDVSPREDDNFYPFGLDWTHCNSLTLADDEYVFSVRKENAMVKIQRSTGALIWQLGGVQSSFTQTSGRAFEGQHSPELTDDGFMLFDNGDVDIDDAYSEAVEYRVNEASRTYTPIWSYDYGQRISSYLLGDVERLENGNTLVAWGSGGTLTEVTPAGDMAFQVSLAIGSANGFTHHVNALGGVLP